MSTTLRGNLGNAEPDVHPVTRRPTIGATDRLRRSGEIALLWVLNGIGPREYFHLGLHRQSLSWAQKRSFASKRWYLTMIEQINPREYRMAAWHKILAAGVLESFSVPTPRVYGTASPLNGLTRDGGPLRSAKDLARLVDRNGIDDLCFKLVGGWSGRGFMLVSFRRDGTRLLCRIAGHDEEVPVERFWHDHIAEPAPSIATPRQRAFGYLCQDVVAQHPSVAALHPPSLNTIRLWMYQLVPGQWEMAGAVLRMGTGSNRIDNGVAGGIGAPIDLETGRLGHAVRRGRPGVRFAEYDVHPTTGVPVTGFEVPYWDEVPALARHAGAAFPFFRFMGLDIAVTPQGLTIVEIEADPHQSHQAHLGMGLKPLVTSLARAVNRDTSLR